MARPSQKKERVEQILDALEMCLARHGVHGATQDRIAEQAGLARPLIRHNVGNREAMLQAGLERFMARADVDLEALFSQLPETARAETLIEWLFDPRAMDTHSVRVLEAFAGWAQEAPAVGVRIIEWTERFIGALASELARALPESEEGARREVATAISALYFQLSSVASLGDADALRADSVAVARRLLDGLA